MDIIDITSKNCEMFGSLFLNKSIDSVSIMYNNNFLPKLYIKNKIDKETVIVENNSDNIKIDNEIVARISPENEYSFLVDKIFLSPYSSICISPEKNDPFIILLGNNPDELKAYHFSGQEGIHIFFNVWFSLPIVYYNGKIPFTVKENYSKIRIKDDVKYQINYI